MQKDEAIKILARHLMQCGMLMPIEWVQKNGEDSEFMQAYKMAMDALKNEPVRCEDCDWYREHEGNICVNPKCGKSWYGCPVPADHFCSYGEKRRNE